MLSLASGLLKRLIERAADLAGSGLGSNETLHVHFVGVADIERVNRDFVGHEGLTDVICFDYRGTCLTPDQDEAVAELLICPEAARRQAEKVGRDFSRELALYLLHGLLHLAGEGDQDPEARRRMRRREREVLSRLEAEFDFAAIFMASPARGIRTGRQPTPQDGARTSTRAQVRPPRGLRSR